MISSDVPELPAARNILLNLFIVMSYSVQVDLGEAGLL